MGISWLEKKWTFPNFSKVSPLDIYTIVYTGAYDIDNKLQKKDFKKNYTQHIY